MISPLAAALLLPSALPWSEFEPGNVVTTTQNLSLGKMEFPSGLKLQLLSAEPLEVPGAPLLYFTLVQNPCPKPEQQSEMEIITPEGNEESSAVGVELAPGCRWGIYLEQKDLYQPSFFGKDQ